jgi:hypothetical protein
MQMIELNDTDKHRRINTTGLRYSAISFGSQHETKTLVTSGYIQAPGSGTFYAPVSAMCPLKSGDVLHVTPIGTDVKQNVKILVDVSLDEPQILTSEPLGSTLDRLAAKIRGTVNQFLPLF